MSPCFARGGSQKNLQSARISSNEWKFRSCKQNFVLSFITRCAWTSWDKNLVFFPFPFPFFDPDWTKACLLIRNARISSRKGTKFFKWRERKARYFAKQSSRIIWRGANEIRSDLSFRSIHPLSDDATNALAAFLISWPPVSTWPRVIMKRNVARAIRHRSNPRAPQFRISTLGPSREQSYLKYSAPSNWFLPRSNKRPRSDLDFERMEEKWRDLCFIIVATRRNTIGEKGNKVDKPEASGDIGVSLGSALGVWDARLHGRGNKPSSSTPSNLLEITKGTLLESFSWNFEYYFE